MQRPGWFVGLVVACLLSWSGPALGQYYGYGGGGWGPTNAGSALMGSDYRQASIIQSAAQARQSGQAASMAQNAVVQGGIRNTLSNQADSRANAILSERQSTQDWFFQNQQQQAAERRAAAYAVPAGGGFGGMMPAAGIVPVDPEPQAALDVIRWPIVLRDKAFATERNAVEAPYRRSPPGLSAPTAADYAAMLKSIEDMQAILEWKLSDGGLPTDQYNEAKAFLAKMQQEAARRTADDHRSATVPGQPK